MNFYHQYKYLVLLICLCSVPCVAQTQAAFSDSKTSSVGLLDPSRFTVHHAMSFDASTGSSSSLKSQSLYSTMITYTFAQPVTMHLNFALPIHSTYNTAQNLTSNNLQSADYFRSIPIDLAIQWKPRENMQFQFRMLRQTASDYNRFSYLPSSLFTE